MGGIVTTADQARRELGNGWQDKKCPIKVLHDVVAIVVATGRTSSGGIIIPDSAKDKTLTGKVAAVGPGRYPDTYVDKSLPDNVVPGQYYEHKAARFPMSVQVGDTAVFPTMVGLDIEVDGVRFYLVHEGDILAVIPK